MEVGNMVFFYIDEAYKQPILYRKMGSISYKKIPGKIIKIYEKDKRITSNEIEDLFHIKPGDQTFGKFYGADTKKKRAVMRTKEGVCYLFTEDMWTLNAYGSDRYVEIASNSLDFILGEDA